MGMCWAVNFNEYVSINVHTHHSTHFGSVLEIVFDEQFLCFQPIVNSLKCVSDHILEHYKLCKSIILSLRLIKTKRTMLCGRIRFFRGFKFDARGN